jgi:UDP-N-acetylglucosamine 2-epimerase (non-hydrolysing)
MGPLVKELQRHPDWFDTRLVVTGQHRQQLQQALAYFDLVPDVDLDIMKEQQSLAYVATAAIAGLDKVMEADRPDIVLAHGDTQTTFCAGLTAFFHRVPVGHVEAGLRSFNKYSPWPEEINRRLVDVVSDIYFAPTEVGRQNLLAEGYQENIYVTGQTAVDAALSTYRKDYTFMETRLNELLRHPGRIIAMTAHRRENYGEPMRQMFSAVRRVVDDNPDVLLIYPVHLSPIVRQAAAEGLQGHERIQLLEPIEFPDMVNLLARSYMVMSDSGGLQEESTVFSRPMVLMRDTTERPEAVEAGAVYLAGTAEADIYRVASRLLSDSEFYNRMASAKNPFGDGHASARIVQILAHYFGFTETLPDEFRFDEER